MKKLESKQMEMVQGGKIDAEEAKWITCGISVAVLGGTGPNPASISFFLTSCFIM